MEAREHERLADHEAWYWWHVARQRIVLRVLEHWAPERPRILDVGCGTGHTTRAVARHVREVVGLDLTEAMLEQGRRLAAEEGVTNARFERGDAEALPFPDARFDVVTCRLCAHHFPHVERAVREARRVLAPGGWLAVCDTVAPEAAAEDTFLNCIELLRDRSHVRNLRVSEWCALLEGCGFEAVEPRGDHPMRLVFESWFERMQTPAGAREQILALFDGAPSEVQRRFAFDLADRTAWSIPIAVLRGRRPGG